MKKIIIPALCILAASIIVGCTSNPEPKVLVAYFSHTGNTHELARQIHAVTGGDMFRIEPVESYPEDDREAHDVGREELDSGYRRALKSRVEDLDSYDIIFIGSPNWFSSYSLPVLTFMSDYDFAGKKVVPFLTYAGSEGRYFEDMAKLVPQAEVLPGFAVKNTEIGNSRAEVEEWIKGLNLK